VQSSVHIVFLGFLFSSSVSHNTCFIIGFYIGLINFWVSVFGLIYRTLETFSLVPFLPCRSVLTGNDLKTGI
jgi:hypothetical protein